jgi:hypothetical protein
LCCFLFVVLFCYFFFCFIYFCFIVCIVFLVTFSVLYMCTELLPPGGYPIAVKYIINHNHHNKWGTETSTGLTVKLRSQLLIFWIRPYPVLFLWILYYWPESGYSWLKYVARMQYIIYPYNENQKDSPFPINYFSNKPLHVSSGPAAHHQEDKLYISSNWYNHALCLLYHLLFIQSRTSWWWATNLLETSTGSLLK